MSPRLAAALRRELTVVSADGSRLHVEVHGPEGAPAIVLAHGWTCSTRFWAAQIAGLARDHRVIAYDQRGHGASPVPATYAAYSTRALADDLEAVAAATLAPGEQAVFAGHSMGGMTLMAAAGRPGFRERAAAVLLCSTGPADLVAEATVLPLKPGRARTWLTARVLGARAPSVRSRRSPGRSSSTGPWAPVRRRTGWTPAPASCTPARAAPGSAGRRCWRSWTCGRACGR